MGGTHIIVGDEKCQDLLDFQNAHIPANADAPPTAELGQHRQQKRAHVERETQEKGKLGRARDVNIMKKVGTYCENPGLQLSFMRLVLLKPPLRPPEFSVVAKPALVPVHHVRIAADIGALGYMLACDGDTTLWHDALEGEGEGRVHADALQHAGVQVRQVADLGPGWVWPGYVGVLEFFEELLECVRVD